MIFWQCKAVARPGVNDYEISIYLSWCHVGLFYFQTLFAIMHAACLPKLKTDYYSFSKKESTVTRFQLTVWVLSIIFVLLLFFFFFFKLLFITIAYLSSVTLYPSNSFLMSEDMLAVKTSWAKSKFPGFSLKRQGSQRLYCFLVCSCTLKDCSTHKHLLSSFLCTLHSLWTCPCFSFFVLHNGASGYCQAARIASPVLLAAVQLKMVTVWRTKREPRAMASIYFVIHPEIGFLCLLSISKWIDPLDPHDLNGSYFSLWNVFHMLTMLLSTVKSWPESHSHI